MSLIRQALEKARQEKQPREPSADPSNPPPGVSPGNEGEKTGRREEGGRGPRYWLWTIVLFILSLLISAQLTYLVLINL